MRKTVSTAATLSLFVALSGIAHANLITNGSFDEGGGQGTSFVTLDANGDAGNTSIKGWTVLGSVDWINNYWQNSNGTNSLDLAGYFKQGMILSDPFTTTPGVTYRVSFDMAGNPDQDNDKALWAVYMNDPDPDPYHGIHPFTFIQDGHTKDDMGWQTHYFDFVAASSTSQLSFIDKTVSPYGEINAFGAALDNVTVEPIPEPSTCLLLAAGLTGMIMLRRKTREA